MIIWNNTNNLYVYFLNMNIVLDFFYFDVNQFLQSLNYSTRI